MKYIVRRKLVEYVEVIAPDPERALEISEEMSEKSWKSLCTETSIDYVSVAK